MQQYLKNVFVRYDWTPLSHAALAIGAQLVIWLALLPWTSSGLLVGAAFGIAYFWGREVAQAEKRWKKEWGPWRWWRGFAMHRWDKGSVLDLVCPVVGCGVILFFKEPLIKSLKSDRLQRLLLVYSSLHGGSYVPDKASQFYRHRIRNA